MSRILATIAIAISTLSLACPAGAQSRVGDAVDTIHTQTTDGTGNQPSSGAGAQPQGQPAEDGAQPITRVAARSLAPLSAEEVVSHYIQALGGKEKLQGLNSLYLDGIAVLPSGAQISVKTWRVYDRLYRREIKFADRNIVIIATPGKGWAASPRTGGEFKPLFGEQLKAMRVEIDPAGPLADYNDKGFKLERAGADTVNGRLCYKIKVSCPSNHSITYSIDAQTYYILREVRKGCDMMDVDDNSIGWKGSGDGTVTIDYSDYRNGPGGYVLPYSLYVEGLGAKMKLLKVEINKTVDVDGLSRPR